MGKTMQEVTIRFDTLTLVIDVPAERVTFIFYGVGRPEPVTMPLEQLINLVHVVSRKVRG